MTPENRSALMKRVRTEHTKPEMKVRRIAHRLGYRFRLHRRDLPGRPDIVFPSRRKVILVHGCFWHAHPDPSCKKSQLPATRPEFWRGKLAANQERDIRNIAALTAMGWDVAVFWECQLKNDLQVERLLIDFLNTGSGVNE